MDNIKITTANAYVKNSILRNAISLEILGEQRHMFEIEKKITNAHITISLKKERLIYEMNDILRDQLQEYTEELAKKTEEITKKINMLDTANSEYYSLLSQKKRCEENMHRLYSKFLEISTQIPDQKEVTNFVLGHRIDDRACSTQTTPID